jgi:lysophospholipase L1-like esterase
MSPRRHAPATAVAAFAIVAALVAPAGAQEPGTDELAAPTPAGAGDRLGAAGARAASVHRLGADGDTVVLAALGDSVASGHGLDMWDLMGDDDCWRAGDESYAGRLEDDLQDALDIDVDRELLACSGATTADLLAPDGQVDDAVALDPDLVTITVGANDLGFTHPEHLVDAAGFHVIEVVQRLHALDLALGDVVDRLLVETDAVIVLTTYHDPTADDPVGVDGCRGDCFASVADIVTQALDGTIARIATRTGPRTLLADVRPAFEGHGATNGWGPDAWREAGLPGWVADHVPDDVVDAFDASQGVQPYCSSQHDWHLEDNWVSGLDCVHPNDDGARAYTRAVVEALQRAGVA